MRGAAFTRLEAGGTWALWFAPKPRVKFNAVVRGHCWLALEGAAPRRLAAGDVFLLANAPAYTVASDPRLPPADGSALFAQAMGGTVTYGGDAVVLIGGAFTLGDAEGDPLPDVLPTFLRIDTADHNAARVRETLARSGPATMSLIGVGDSAAAWPQGCGAGAARRPPCTLNAPG